MAEYHMRLRSAAKRKVDGSSPDEDDSADELESVSNSFSSRYGYNSNVDQGQDNSDMEDEEQRKAAMAHFYLHGAEETVDNNLTPAATTPTNTDDPYATNLLDDNGLLRTTPPPPDLESFFPPSPYGKSRKQVYGDRFIPQRDPNLTRDFQLMDPSFSRGTRNTTDLTEQEAASDLEERRMFFFYRSEVLNDPHAYTNFMESEAAIANNQVRTPRRLYHYSSPRDEHRTLPSSSGNNNNNNNNSTNNNNNNNNNNSNNSNYINTDDTTSSGEGGNTTSTNMASFLRNANESDAFFSPPTPSTRQRPTAVSDTGLRILGAHQTPTRYINRTAIKILDAPELEDDFYLNLVDWGPNDCLAVGLGNCVYLWDANTSRVTKLVEFANERISSVCWAQQGKHLAIGTNGANTQLWDVRASKRLRTWHNHKGRVSSLAWNMNILTSGSKDHHIFHQDIRSPSQYFRDMNVHHQEVCGLKWSPDGSMLASGGNDNKLMIWNSHENLVMHKFSEHTAAVKAIAWCPYDRSLLVSGGGTADKSIKFWNAQRGAMLDSFDTGSQVCNIVWSKRSKEIVSTHGYANQQANASNQVVVWNARTMNRVATLSGHTSRVLFMSMDTNGSTVVTGAGDETLRFWDVFGSVDPQRKGVDRAFILR